MTGNTTLTQIRGSALRASDRVSDSESATALTGMVLLRVATSGLLTFADCFVHEGALSATFVALERPAQKAGTTGHLEKVVTLQAAGMAGESHARIESALAVIVKVESNRRDDLRECQYAFVFPRFVAR